MLWSIRWGKTSVRARSLGLEINTLRLGQPTRKHFTTLFFIIPSIVFWFKCKKSDGILCILQLTRKINFILSSLDITWFNKYIVTGFTCPITTASLKKNYYIDRDKDRKPRGKPIGIYSTSALLALWLLCCIIASSGEVIRYPVGLIQLVCLQRTCIDFRLKRRQNRWRVCLNVKLSYRTWWDITRMYACIRPNTQSIVRSTGG